MLLSLVSPVYNEAESLPGFHRGLVDALTRLGAPGEGFDYEIVYVDDGSVDGSARVVAGLGEGDGRVRLVALTRNYGKEAALAAGIRAARGAATLVLDSDGQHPPEMIGQFVAAWRAGANVVVGVRAANPSAGIAKRMASGAFYRLSRILAGDRLIPESTDFCLIDAAAREAFLRYPESGRMTRAIVQSLGFTRAEVVFTADPRIGGTASYSRAKLMGLARDSITSSSSTPLRFPAVIGAVLAVIALVTGTAVLIQQVILGDPWGWDFTGTAMLGLLITFLTGLILLSMGVLGMYMAAVQREVLRRPLYLVDEARSIGL
ncbi:MAG: glycosyltransferase family 2 protein [Bifidobacteriaceae bacterium]|nr:glycosyltransferase family 2 protein [Bifidobacteriaceae bacterium]